MRYSSSFCFIEAHLDIAAENATEDMKTLASQMNRLSFYSSEVLKMMPLLDLGFKPNDIVRALTVFNLDEHKEQTKAIQEVSKLVQLKHHGFTEKQITEEVISIRDANEDQDFSTRRLIRQRNDGESILNMMSFLPLSEFGFTSEEIIRARKEMNSYDFEKLLPHLTKGN